MYKLVQMCVVLCLTMYICKAVTITQSADRLVLGSDHRFTCIIDGAYFGLNFIVNGSEICTFDKCKLIGCNNSFLYTCDISTRNFTLTIPGSFTNDSYHHSAWQCREATTIGSNSIFLYITVPISSVEITPSTTDLSVGNSQILTCKTSAGRPNARIQWYLSDGTNLTASAIQQPDCGQCINQVESISNVTYIGKLNDHGKFIFCVASNVEGGTERSQNVTIRILYGPNSTILSPITQLYTVNETTGSIGPITCIADCRPKCTMTWTGPNLLSGTTSQLTIQNIKRNQTGNYQCTANNSVGSLTSEKVEVIVNYGPNDVILNTSAINITVIENKGSIGPITCTADCRPDCTMKWSGPHLSSSTKSVLYLENINRKQAGNYTCTAYNFLGHNISRILMVIVNYGPNDVILNPVNKSYTVREHVDLGPIICTADCRPSCTMTWIGTILPSGTLSPLNLRNISRIMAGDYRCKANNSFGNYTSALITIIVHYAPTIQLIEGNTTQYENDTAEFRCHVDSFPKSFIKWKFMDIHSVKTFPDANEPNFKVNGSLLIVSPISCLSMGLYSCQANNSVRSTQMDFNVTVMCGPRLNTIEYDVKDNIAVKDKQPLNITAPVIAYPKPWIYWRFFQNGSSLNITNDVENSYNQNRLFSYLYIQNMTQNDFGIYAIYAGNGIGDNTNFIGTYDVQAARRPDKPSNVSCSAGPNYIIVNWKPGFHGGSPQSFQVFYKTIQDNLFTGHSDTISEASYHPVKILNLHSSSVYLLKVHAKNIYNITTSDEVHCNTTSQVSPKPKSLIDVGVGAGVGSAFVVICVVIALLFLFQRLRKKNLNNDKEPIKRSNEEEENDELKDNPLYVSSVDDFLHQRNVDNEKKKVISSSNPNKKKKKEKSIKPIELGCVYENADDIMERTGQIFANQQDAKKDITMNYNPRKNRDGLIYADLDLTPTSEGQRFVIHGIDNKNNYAIIDLSKRADPLPSDDEEETVKSEENKN